MPAGKAISSALSCGGNRWFLCSRRDERDQVRLEPVVATPFLAPYGGVEPLTGGTQALGPHVRSVGAGGVQMHERLTRFSLLAKHLDGSSRRPGRAVKRVQRCHPALVDRLVVHRCHQSPAWSWRVVLLVPDGDDHWRSVLMDPRCQPDRVRRSGAGGAAGRAVRSARAGRGARPTARLEGRHRRSGTRRASAGSPTPR